MIYAWLENPVKFEKSHAVNNTLDLDFEIVPMSGGGDLHPYRGGLPALHRQTFD